MSVFIVQTRSLQQATDKIGPFVHDALQSSERKIPQVKQIEGASLDHIQKPGIRLVRMNAVRHVNGFEDACEKVKHKLEFQGCRRRIASATRKLRGKTGWQRNARAIEQIDRRKLCEESDGDSDSLTEHVHGHDEHSLHTCDGC